MVSLPYCSLTKLLITHLTILLIEPADLPSEEKNLIKTADLPYAVL